MTWERIPERPTPAQVAEAAESYLLILVEAVHDLDPDEVVDLGVMLHEMADAIDLSEEYKRRIPEHELITVAGLRRGVQAGRAALAREGA